MSVSSEWATPMDIFLEENDTTGHFRSALAAKHFDRRATYCSALPIKNRYILITIGCVEFNYVIFNHSNRCQSRARQTATAQQPQNFTSHSRTVHSLAALDDAPPICRRRPPHSTAR